jgi:hypothetical protein
MEDIPSDWEPDASDPEDETAGEPDADMPSGMERRLVLRVLSYWREIAGERRFPTFADVDPSAVSSMWPYCFVLDVAGDPDDPVYRIAGHEFASHAGRRLAGMKVSEVPADTLIEKSIVYMDEVLIKKVPITRGGEFSRPDGAKILYRSILLPMSDDDTSISGLLGAANCRIVPGDG